jgi:hypothetical protein
MTTHRRAADAVTTSENDYFASEAVQIRQRVSSRSSKQHHDGSKEEKLAIRGAGLGDLLQALRDASLARTIGERRNGTRCRLC